jgi:hypothetical protein
MARGDGLILTLWLRPRAAALPFPPLNDIRRGMATMPRQPRHMPNRHVSD